MTDEPRSQVSVARNPSAIPGSAVVLRRNGTIDPGSTVIFDGLRRLGGSLGNGKKAIIHFEQEARNGAAPREYGGFNARLEQLRQAIAGERSFSGGLGMLKGILFGNYPSGRLVSLSVRS